MTRYDTRYDVVTLGESMLRLTPPGLLRLEQTRSLDIEVAGSESNTAVGLARLGLKTCWLSRLPDNALGHLAAGELERHGVDTRHVCWTDDARMGLYFVEQGAKPRGAQVIYDRKDSAVSLIQPSDVPSNLFTEQGARLFHTSGISLAIGKSAAQTTLHALSLAKGAGWLVSFDVNHRSKLWSYEEAKAGCHGAMATADIIFVAQRDARAMFGLESADTHIDTPRLLETLAQTYPQALTVITQGAAGAAARTPDGEVFTETALPAEAVDRVGGGDAFSAGFLYGYLTFGSVPTALRWGVVVAALKYSIRGDLPLVNLPEVQALVEGQHAAAITR